jgi:hypothetical protein
MKLAKDPAYREQCRDSQKNWREQNAGYMQRYRAKLKAKNESSQRAELLGELRRLLKLVENNVALATHHSEAHVWLIYLPASETPQNKPRGSK